MPVTDSQVFLLGPGATTEAGWYLAPNKVVQAVASAVAIRQEQSSTNRFSPDGAVLSVGGPVYSLIADLTTRATLTPTYQYIVRWPVTNRGPNWYMVKLSYTVVSETNIYGSNS